MSIVPRRLAFGLRNVALAAATFGIVSVPAMAAEIIVNPGDPAWADGSTPPASATITATAPRSGTGSLELQGDRTRFFGLGNPFSTSSNLGLLSTVSSFHFDWNIAADSISNLGADYTPALRLHIYDGTQRSELIWEGAYNGTYGNTSVDTWYTTGDSDNFWRFVAGAETTDAGALVTQSIADWATGSSSAATPWYSAGAYVAAVSIGAGSTAGASYHAFGDNLTLAISGGGPDTYNFEAAAVPAPGVLVLMLLGVGGLLMRRRG